MKLLKRLGIVVIVAILFHLTLLATNNLHLYKTLKQTVLKGKLGPSIDEYSAFENRSVNVGTHEPWKVSNDYNNKELSEQAATKFKELNTVAYLVIKHGKIVHESYWDGYSKKSLSNSFSMAKSILNMAIGQLIRQGKIGGIDDKVSDYLPQLDVSSYPNLTIRHLLQMSSGINFDENYINPFAYPAKANYGTDLLELTYSYKVTEKPGEKFEYRSGNSQLLSFLIAEVSGMPTSEFVSQAIWKPIGAKYKALWSLDHANGNEKGFCCFNSNARDFARLGKLYLQKGIWNGDTIVDPSFVEASISKAPIVDVDGKPTERYGLHWWLHNHQGKKVFYARGILGQYIAVVPSDDLIVVRLGEKRIRPTGVASPPDLTFYLNEAYRITEALQIGG